MYIYTHINVALCIYTVQLRGARKIGGATCNEGGSVQSTPGEACYAEMQFQTCRRGSGILLREGRLCATHRRNRLLSNPI